MIKFSIHKFSAATLFFALIIISANAQSKVDQKVKQVGEAVDALNSLKGLFGKKKKAELNNNATDIVQTDKQLAGKVVFAGKLSPTVKYVDCDIMYPFKNGAALVKKGNAEALIDSSGKFIVPYFKYNSIYDGSENYLTSSGSILRATSDYSNGNLRHYINTKGKVLYDDGITSDYYSRPSEDNKFVVLFKLINANSTAVILIDVNGKRTSLNVPGKLLDENNYFGVRDSVITYSSVVGNKTLYGFRNIRGKGIMPTYDLIEPFNDGVAVFTVRDNFGVYKFGLINKDGVIISEAKFTNKPSPYRYGHTLVRASNGADFQSAYIDVKGNIVFKQTLETQKKYGYFQNFSSDFAASAGIYGGEYLLHKSGKVISQADFFNSFKFDFENYSYPTVVESTFRMDDRNIRFTFTKKGNQLKTFYGIYNLDSQSVLYFDMNDGNIMNNLYAMDPVSKLMYANLNVGEKDKNGVPVPRVGYVNIKGEFVLVKGTKKSDW